MSDSAATRVKKSRAMKRYWKNKKRGSSTSTGRKKTWREFTKGKMGKYMKAEGSHGAAMKRLSREWKKYKG